jgi:hypothetical protein
VDNATIQSGDYSGMWKLTTLTAAVCVLPLLFLRLLPSAARQKQLAGERRSSRSGGAAFVAVLALSILWSVAVALVEVAGSDAGAAGAVGVHHTAGGASASTSKAV